MPPEDRAIADVLASGLPSKNALAQISPMSFCAPTRPAMFFLQGTLDDVAVPWVSNWLNDCLRGFNIPTEYLAFKIGHEWALPAADKAFFLAHLADFIKANASYRAPQFPQMEHDTPGP